MGDDARTGFWRFSSVVKELLEARVERVSDQGPNRIETPPRPDGGSGSGLSPKGVRSGCVPGVRVNRSGVLPGRTRETLRWADV